MQEGSSIGHSKVPNHADNHQSRYWGAKRSLVLRRLAHLYPSYSIVHDPQIGRLPNWYYSSIGCHSRRDEGCIFSDGVVRRCLRDVHALAFRCWLQRSQFSHVLKRDILLESRDQRGRLGRTRACCIRWKVPYAHAQLQRRRGPENHFGVRRCHSHRGRLRIHAFHFGGCLHVLSYKDKILYFTLPG